MIDRMDAIVIILYHQQMLQVAAVVCFFIVRGQKDCTFFVLIYQVVCNCVHNLESSNLLRGGSLVVCSL